MLITTLMVSALAESPHAEVLAGLSGNAAQSYGFVTVQPALVRSERTRLLARATVSHLHFRFTDGGDVTQVDSPGLAVGPAAVFAPGDLALTAGLTFSARHFSTREADRPRDRRVTLDGALTGDVFWRPGQRAQLYTQLSLGAVGWTLWGRLGATCPVTPRAKPVSLWLGLEGTSSGSLPSLSTEIGPVAEVPLAPLRATLGMRVATPVRDLARGTLLSRQTTLGLAAYWAY